LPDEHFRDGDTGVPAGAPTSEDDPYLDTIRHPSCCLPHDAHEHARVAAFHHPQAYMVQVPAGVGPGQQFHANIGGQLVAVAVPAGVSPGQTLQIRVPVRTVAAVPVQQQQRYQQPPAQRAPAAPPKSMLEQEAEKQRAAEQRRELDAARKKADEQGKSAQKQIEQNQRHRANADDAKEYALREEAQRKAKLGVGSQRVNVNHPGEVSALWWLNMGL
jgi:hypothetical protein